MPLVILIGSYFVIIPVPEYPFFVPEEKIEWYPGNLFFFISFSSTFVSFNIIISGFSFSKYTSKPFFKRDLKEKTFQLIILISPLERGG